MKHLRIALILLGMVLACGLSMAEAAEPQAENAIRTGETRLEGAARKAGAAGVKAEQWALERENLLNEARQLLFDTETTRFAVSRQHAYIKREQADILELSERLETAQTTRRGLDQLMEALYSAMAQSQNTGLPIAQDERQTRLALVRRTLDDPDAPGGEKLRGILDALSVEAGYGFDMEAEDAVMPVNGTPMALTLLRVGRLALLRFPASGAWVERFDRDSKGWLRLDDPHAREVIKAVQITRKQRIAELITLPIGSQAQLIASQIQDTP